jgi:hypothetical protein
MSCSSAPEAVAIPLEEGMVISLQEHADVAIPKQDSNIFLHSWGSLHGKKSMIHDHCMERIKKHKACIWLCKRLGRMTIAWDVPLEDPERAAIDLKSLEPSWSRYSFYGFVGVRHVEV